MKNITIIGGGACGTAVFIELLLQIATSGLASKIKISIIEKDKTLGYGLAFSTEQPGHLLNTQTELMGIHVYEPGHFSNWLEQHGGRDRRDVKGKGEADQTYTTRQLYGVEEEDRQMLALIPFFPVAASVTVYASFLESKEEQSGLLVLLTVAMSLLFVPLVAMWF